MSETVTDGEIKFICGGINTTGKSYPEGEADVWRDTLACPSESVH